MIRPAAVRSLRGKTLAAHRDPENMNYKSRPSAPQDLPRPAPTAIKIRLHAAQSISSVRNPR